MAEALHTSPHPWLTATALACTPDLVPGLDPVALQEGLERLSVRLDLRALVVFGSRTSENAGRIPISICW